MPDYKVKLLERKDVAEGTMAFFFEKPGDFSYKAGQHGDFTLINPPETDEEGNTRTFTLANPPSAKELMIATRMRNTAFKRTLKELPLGTELKFVGPSGSFVLHNNASIPAMFLTGGIGITPARSIIMQATKDKLPHSIFLFYSNHRPEDTAFLEDLKTLENENPNFTFIPTMTDMSKSKYKWRGEVGHIDQKMLEKYNKHLLKPIYYLSGPPAMVAAMRKLLNEVGVNDDNIRTEEFSGY